MNICRYEVDTARYKQWLLITGIFVYRINPLVNPPLLHKFYIGTLIMYATCWTGDIILGDFTPEPRTFSTARFPHRVYGPEPP